MGERFTCLCPNMNTLKCLSHVQNLHTVTRMYIYIYVNLHTYIKEPQVKLHCGHVNFIARGISQFASVKLSVKMSSYILFWAGKTRRNFLMCSSGTNFGTIQKKRCIEKGNIISIQWWERIHWWQVICLQSRQSQFKPWSPATYLS